MVRMLAPWESSAEAPVARSAFWCSTGSAMLLLVAANAAPPRRSKEVMAAAETEPPRSFSAQSGVDVEALKVRR
jgi:hypothetical protein